MAEGTDLNKLLEQMPKIAEAVSAFPEAVQQQAFDALMAAASGAPVTTTPVREQNGDSSSKTPSKKRSTRSNSASDENGGAKKKRGRGAPTAIKDLDLAPKGKKSFAAFVEEKQPKTQHDKNAVSVYYLEHVLGETPITLNHVFTCYRDAQWPVPTNPANSLALTAARRMFLDTSDLDDIKLMPRGLNHVEQALPPKST